MFRIIINQSYIALFSYTISYSYLEFICAREKKNFHACSKYSPGKTEEMLIVNNRLFMLND